MDRPLVEVVTERDIDLLLIEELNVRPEFLAWWIASVRGPSCPSDHLIGAFHSVTHPTLGESDLLILYRDAAGAHHAILAENKIDAPAQPDQADRYRRRGEAGVASGDWTSFRTCICAPHRYLESSTDAAKYDSRVPYENIRDWLKAVKHDVRCQYRAKSSNPPSNRTSESTLRNLMNA